MTATSEVLRFEVVDRVVTVTLSRPSVRNALNVALLRGLRDAMAAADADPDVDVVVLTGDDPAFCAGLDLRELGSTGANLGAAPGGSGFGFWAPIAKPVIGAVNGPAVTGGFEIALQCDWLVASERATFGDTHARVGVMPGGGMTVLLPQAIGVRRAREMSLTGNFLSAHEAFAWGLVNHVVPHESLLPTAWRLARDVCGVDQRGVRHVLDMYRQAAATTAGEGLTLERRLGAAFASSAGGFDPAEVERRRQAIIDRGRTQI